MSSGKLFKSLLELGPVQFRPDFAVQICLSQQRIVEGANICTSVKPSSSQVRLPVERPVERDLKDPTLDTAFRSVKKHRFLIYIEKRFLDYVFGLTAIAYDASRNAEHQTRIAVEENLQG